MAKKANQTSPDPTNSTEPTPNSSPLDEAQANPNAATTATGHVNTTDNIDGSDGPADDNENVAPAPDDVNDPNVQESQPSEQPEDSTASPTTEATLTHEGDTTQSVPAGSADATADHTADGQHNGTENTHPQSPLHEDDLDEMTKADIVDEMNEPGAVVGNVAAKYNVTPERVFQIVDEGAAARADEE